MRIVRLQAEGFKRIVAVDITPEGDLVEVRGNNENGKSSVLDAIFAALGGAEAAPERPVRDGEEAAVIRLDLGELVVTRYFTAAGTTGLKVTTPDGAAYGSAQTMLDKLVGKISFDPLAFRDLKPAEQADELRKLVELVDPEPVPLRGRDGGEPLGSPPPSPVRLRDRPQQKWRADPKTSVSKTWNLKPHCRPSETL